MHRARDKHNSGGGIAAAVCDAASQTPSVVRLELPDRRALATLRRRKEERRLVSPPAVTTEEATGTARPPGVAAAEKSSPATSTSTARARLRGEPCSPPLITRNKNMPLIYPPPCQQTHRREREECTAERFRGFLG
ncbi:hypothetical protein MTO96_014520 [Rhipicephalus appendiculatus]